VDERILELRRRLEGGDPSARAPLRQALLRGGQGPELGWSGLPFDAVIEWDTLEDRLTPEGLAAFRRDLGNVDPEKVLRNFPRGADDRLPLGVTVLLASYPARKEQRRSRALWLAATSPKRRRDAQLVSLVLESLIERNHPHVWDQARFLWDGRCEANEEDVWGSAALPWQRTRSALERKKRLSPPERIVLCAKLQDAGAWKEALDLYEVTLDDFLTHLVEDRTHVHDGCEDWHAMAEELLLACAPWRFEQTLAAAESAAKKRRGRVELRLLALPKQAWQRKAAVYLTRDPETQGPQLAIIASGSNDRLSECRWKRPPEAQREPPWARYEAPLPEGVELPAREASEDPNEDPWEGLDPEGPWAAGLRE
jgi:hypothetical protein